MTETPSKIAIAITWLGESIFGAAVFTLFEYVNAYRVCANSQVFFDCMPRTVDFVDVFIGTALLIAIILLSHIIISYIINRNKNIHKKQLR